MSIIEDLERKLEQLIKQPSNFLLFNHIGVLLYELKDWINAEIYFQRAYQLNSSNKDILYNYASILDQQDKFQKAIPIYEAYLELDNHNKEFIQRLGDCYYQIGEYDSAKNMYEKLQKV